MKNLFLRLLTICIVLAAMFKSSTHGFAVGLTLLAVGGFAVSLLHDHSKYIPKGSFAVYTGTAIADIFIPEVYRDIEVNDRVDTTAFVESGVAVTTDDLVKAANSGTKKIETPIWNDIDASSEPNYSDDSDDDATPGKITTDSYEARNAYLNWPMGAKDIAREMAKATPGAGGDGIMTRIKGAFGRYWKKQFSDRNIAIARGLYACNVAQNSSDMVYDISLQTLVGQSDANKISAEAVVGATFTLGDRFNNLSIIAMHSVPYSRLVLQQLIDYVKDADGKILYTTYLGYRVVVDDTLPVIAGTTSGLRYLTVLYGQGVIGYGEGTPTVPVAMWRNELKGKGGGEEGVIERATWLIHPQGFNWTDTTVTGQTPTLANLRLAANWERILPRKKINIAFLVTNG